MSEKLYPEALSQDANLPAEGNEAAARALYFADAHESSSSGNKWPDFDSPDNAAKDRYYEVSHEVVRAYLAALPAPRTIETVEELEALPVGAIVLDGDLSGPVQMVEKSQIVGAEWAVLAVGVTYTSSYITLPARVLWVPTE